MRDLRARWLLVAVALLAADAVAQADARPRDVMHWMTPSHEHRTFALDAKADTNIIYMNSCRPNGCKVTVGNTDSRVDTSDIASQNGTLSAWSYGDSSWQKTMTCMREVFSRFNVTVTDVDPGMTPHYEVMVAGSPEQIMGSQGFGIGGVADFPCQDVGNCDPYLPNALVFDFSAVFGNDPTEICAVAAQEIAHTWALDHVVDPSDPLTYNNYNGMREYHDGEKCGSDCQGGKSPFGLTCSGSGGNATHTCSGTGTATQDEVKTMLTLFGPSGPPTPPTVAITSPADGANVTPQFKITATAMDDQGVDKLELRIDGSLIGTVTKQPYTWTAPASLAQGPHTIKVTAYDTNGTPADAQVSITEGQPCASPSDCSDSMDTCVDGRCVPGGDAPGGLGTVCTSAAQCASGICASDSTGNKVCVEDCDPTKNGCPGGFSCIQSGDSGVCWPTGGNGDEGGGGCSTSGGDGDGLALIGLGFAAIVVAGRRRRR